MTAESVQSLTSCTFLHFIHHGRGAARHSRMPRQREVKPTVEDSQGSVLTKIDLFLGEPSICGPRKHANSTPQIPGPQLSCSKAHKPESHVRSPAFMANVRWETAYVVDSEYGGPC